MNTITCKQLIQSMVENICQINSSLKVQPLVARVELSAKVSKEEEVA